MNAQLNVRKFALTLSLFGIISGLGEAALAQYNNPAKPNDGYQRNEQNSLGGSVLGGIDPMQLIHNANLKRSRGAEEFNEDTQTNLDSAAEKFKRQQQQQFQNQPPKTPTVNPATKN